VAAQAVSIYTNIAAISLYQVSVVPAGTAAANRAANVLVSITPTAPPFAAATGHTIVIADKAAGGGPPTAFVLTDQ
jgi:hypothetical protein